MVKTIDYRPKTIDHRLFEEAKRYMAGGVNSPVRSFKAVGGDPVFIDHAKGAKIYGKDDRELIDYCLSWGALILGHAHPKIVEELKKAIDKGIGFGTPTKLETELARLITEAVPSIEKVRLTNSGTEAVMGAIRVARAFTGKDKIIKFEGSYHGHVDYLLNCEGVPKDFMSNTLSFPYNDIERVEIVAKRYKEEIAAIIVEPIAANMGVVLPRFGFLQALRKTADKHKIVLIFDEVITGFRLGLGGAQEFFDIRPDLTCLGKIIGGGLPIGAFGGRDEMMRLLAPEGKVYQAGTFSGNPITVTAGITTLRILEKNKPYEKLESATNQLCEEIESRAKRYNIKLKINHIASMFSIFFTDRDVVDLKGAQYQDTNLFKRFFHYLLREGVYLSPSGFETNFLSTAHNAEDLDKTIKTIDKILNKL